MWTVERAAPHAPGTPGASAGVRHGSAWARDRGEGVVGELRVHEEDLELGAAAEGVEVGVGGEEGEVGRLAEGAALARLFQAPQRLGREPVGRGTALGFGG